jgi:YHS domain-containing protein
MFRFLGLLLAFIFVVPLIRLVLGVIGRAFSNFAAGPKRPSVRTQPLGGALHLDPVCGTYVSEQSAVKLRDGQQTRFFCSEECLKKFRLDPPAPRA